LTHSEGNELPVAWAADNETVLFVSNRAGPWGIFKQSLKTERPETIVGTAFLDGLNPSVSLSGEWVLYLDDRSEGGYSQPKRLMRVPLAGGQPEVVLTGYFEGQSCGRSPGAFCALAERTPDRKQLIFTRFEPLNGRGRELTRLDVDSHKDYEWNLSPDGTRIAIHKINEGPIQIISLAGQATKLLNATGWNSIENLHWAADGKGIYSASRSVDSSVLLYLALQSNPRVVWEEKGTMGNDSAGTSAIPSPDGRHIALMGYTYNANLWLLEDF
jgi:Tol biopolymer transport system component